ncbi:Endonuclease/Exonuclease/phosphatase family protein [Microbacterium terrae]|uniref:Endonuclease/Exonuclease/phosphatase family protein n=1 Tax=Microbacterium terrae TaxID=69369 RepID=A0A0M2HMV2_9MICO|nr:endonuclease/exonuclease/phosphatase family protein [Microbacterium terrae]KJL45781.1 Endonuclease/Exonuclease/phosphatase family protein [Microbacterium terrae]
MAAQTMRIAAYNVENLFSRPRAMNRPEPIAVEILRAHARINELFERETYTAEVKAEILQLLGELRLLRDDGGATRTSTFVVLRRIRGRLLRRPRNDPDGSAVTVVADGRADWTGWVELIKDRIDERAISNTARVIDEVGADIVGVVEAEDRLTLARFTDSLLIDDATGQPQYPHVMVIDGNDPRGIDVGVLARAAYPLALMRSHIDDGPHGDRVFSRDCPEYWFTFPAGTALAGERLVVLVNHFKSKFGGNNPASIARRRRQSARAAEIYTEIRAAGVDHVVVLGDFNDTPDSEALAPLLADTDLTDIAAVTPFDDGDPDEERPGTFGNGTKSSKIDYLLLSPSLLSRATGAGIFRKGVWGGVHGTLFPHFDTIEADHEAASDHAALYVDIDLS